MNLLKLKKKPIVEGNLFQRVLSTSAKIENYDVEEIPHYARIIGKQANGKPSIALSKSPFDFIFTKDGRSLFIDAKKTDKNTFDSSLITPHQVQSLIRKSEKGCHAGYIIFFKTKRIVTYIQAAKLFKSQMDRQSLSPLDGLIIGDDLKISLDKIMHEAVINPKM